MRRVFPTFLLMLSLTTYGQKGSWNPFKLCILKPDTAIIDKSLFNERDSIESDNLKTYYNSIKQMEVMLNFKDYPKEMEKSFKETRDNYEKQIPLLKAREDEVKKFKYYQTISQISTQVYNFYFNESEPFSTIIQLPNQKTDLVNLKTLADTLKADYIIFYKDIHTLHKDGSPILRLTTSLYSKKDNQVILEKTTEGDMYNKGSMWACSMTLSCLLINGVKTSTDAVTTVLQKRQIKQK